MAKAKLSALAAELKETESPAGKKLKRGTNAASGAIIANPERGQRGHFVRATIMIPAEMLIALHTLGLKRRERGKKDTGVSELVREAVATLIEREDKQ